MKLFLAGAGWEKTWMEVDYYNFNRLHTFFHMSENEAKVLHKYNNFLLDSGAFSMFGGAKVNLKEYVNKYIDFINKYDVKHFFELDIYQLIGNAETEEIREYIEIKTNKNTIPVFHIFLGIDYFKNLCDKYNYIAISASGKFYSKWTRKHPEKLYKLLQYAKTKKVRIHGLGYTSNKMAEMPFYSVDSTSWLSGNRFGAVYSFKNKTMLKYDKPKGKRVKTHETNKHNFFEWVKYGKYLNTIQI